MRILFVSPWMPSATWGAATRTYQFLRMLSVRHSVTLLTYAEPGHEGPVATLKAFCHAVHVIERRKSTTRKRLDQLSSVFSRASFQWRNMYTPEMQQTLQRLCRQERFDLIQLESSQLAGLDIDPGPLLVVDEHNVEYELLYRMYQSERSVLRRAYNWLEYRKFRRDEVSAWRRASGVLTTSSREEEIVRSIVPDVPTLTAPNAVDVEFFTPGAARVDPDAIVLTGLMKYRPNVDAAQFFVRDVLPRLLRVRPTLKFFIVGGSPSEEVKQLAGPNVVVTDTVPDVRPYVHAAAVVVVPLRMGSGTRLKVLEGLSMRKPMVSTSLGCEGIDVESGRHLLVADDAEAFATSILHLLENRDLADRLASQGRDLVERRYRWESVVADAERFYETLEHRRGNAAASLLAS